MSRYQRRKTSIRKRSYYWLLIAFIQSTRLSNQGRGYQRVWIRSMMLHLEKIVNQDCSLRWLRSISQAHMSIQFLRLLELTLEAFTLHLRQLMLSSGACCCKDPVYLKYNWWLEIFVQVFPTFSYS